MCQKIPFETKQDANDYIRQVHNDARRHTKQRSRGSAKNNKKLRPYLCRHCGKWHLTSQKKVKHHVKNSN